MKFDKIGKPRRLIPILPGLMTPSEIDSDIVLPEIGLQAGRELTNLSQDINEITEIVGSENEHGQPNQLVLSKPKKRKTFLKPNIFLSTENGDNDRGSEENRISALEKQNAQISRALYNLSSRVSTIEALNISLGPDSGFNSYRNFSNRPETVNETTKNLMGAMKISNELITELGDRVRRSEGKIEELKYGSGRGLKDELTTLKNKIIQLEQTFTNNDKSIIYNESRLRNSNENLKSVSDQNTVNIGQLQKGFVDLKSNTEVFGNDLLFGVGESNLKSYIYFPN